MLIEMRSILSPNIITLQNNLSLSFIIYHYVLLNVYNKNIVCNVKFKLFIIYKINICWLETLILYFIFIYCISSYHIFAKFLLNTIAMSNPLMT